MADQHLANSPPRASPDAGTPRDDFDETLGRAIDAGRLDPALAAADPKLAGVFAAHQKLESLFALLRGQPADQPEPTPTQLGRYQVQSTLGAGAFGTVYLAHDPELNRDVAIKVLRSGTFASADALDKFRAEARHAASLNHPQIVAIHDVGRDGERLYIVMHYVRGRTLADLMGEGPVAPARAAELLAAVADALHYAHKLGFVHRDLKPTNILLDEQDRPHVADFGLAVSEETQRKLAGQIAGTPAYMSPEQCRGETHHLDGRADIWGLGVIGYELLTGRHPFWHSDVAACLDEIQHREPKPPRQIDDTIPADLERIILKCLVKQPTGRYNTAGDLAVELRRWRKSREGRARRALERARAELASGSVAGDIVGAVPAQEWNASPEWNERPGRLEDPNPPKPAPEAQRNAGRVVTILRWIACVPSAIAGGIALHLIVLLFNRWSLEFQFLNPDSVFGRLTCLTISSAVLGGATVRIAAAVAPDHEKAVAVVVAGSILFLSGLTAYNVILDSDWWGAYQIGWANAGAVGTAYLINDGGTPEA